MADKEILWYMMKLAIYRNLRKDYFVAEVVGGKVSIPDTQNSKEQLELAKETNFYEKITKDIEKVSNRGDIKELIGYIVFKPKTNVIERYLTTSTALKQSFKEIDEKISVYLDSMNSDRKFILTNITKESKFTLNVDMKTAIDLATGGINLKDIQTWGILTVTTNL